MQMRKVSVEKYMEPLMTGAPTPAYVRNPQGGVVRTWQQRYRALYEVADDDVQVTQADGTIKILRGRFRGPRWYVVGRDDAEIEATARVHGQAWLPQVQQEAVGPEIIPL